MQILSDIRLIIEETRNRVARSIIQEMDETSKKVGQNFFEARKRPMQASQILKDPTVLEFLGLKPEASYYESEIEDAIIVHLQDFLLELGNGFSFVARQKRIILEGDEFKIDLVFYNRLLQCFVIFDIKMDKITHQDLGQLQMYVNYYDRDIKADFENPTIGVLLCADKNDAVVKYSLPLSNQQIFASKYQLHLPSETQLLEEIKKELARFERDDEG
jgi:predicted nuclease of restriction endonuclease-like (RecB) superfamily